MWPTNHVAEYMKETGAHRAKWLRDNGTKSTEQTSFEFPWLPAVVGPNLCIFVQKTQIPFGLSELRPWWYNTTAIQVSWAVFPSLCSSEPASHLSISRLPQLDSVNTPLTWCEIESSAKVEGHSNRKRPPLSQLFVWLHSYAGYTHFA